MRVSTSQGYDNATSLMAKLTAATDRLQAQVATGKKVTTASDDPAAWRRLAALKTASADDAASTANVTAAQAILSQSDTTLASVQSQVQRAQELAVQANSGTLSADDRKIIATQLRGIVDDLYALANTKTGSGVPLYAGSGETAFTRAADGTVHYAGNDGGATIPIGDTSVVVGDSGERVFGNVFATLAGFADALDAGTDVPAAATNAITGLADAASATSSARASVGARAARLDLDGARLTATAVDREAERSGLEDADLSTTIADLQKTMTVLQATQASFTKLSSLSLFDYLK